MVRWCDHLFASRRPQVSKKACNSLFFPRHTPSAMNCAFGLSHPTPLARLTSLRSGVKSLLAGSTIVKAQHCSSRVVVKGKQAVLEPDMRLHWGERGERGEGTEEADVSVARLP